MAKDIEINPLFNALFNDNLYDKRYYQVYGGRGSGKSFQVMVAAVQKVRSTKYGHKILILRQTLSSIEDSSLADVKKVIEILGLSHEFKEKAGLITHKETGNTISFKGIKSTGSQTAKLKSLSGISTLIIEEAEEVESFAEFSKVDESIRELNIPLKIILVYNPTSSIKSWIHKEWFKNGLPNKDRFHDTIFIHSTYLDNLKHLAPSVIRRYKDLEHSDETYYKNTILAEWTLGVQNRVYGGWRLVKEGEIVPEGEVWYGLDFGYGGKDNTALIKITYSNGIYYVEELICQNDLTISATAQKMVDIGVPFTAKIYADSAVPTLLEEIRLKGFKSIRRASKGNVESNIKKVQDKFIVMVSKGENLYYEYMTFSRKENGKLPHEPDVLVAIRYAINSKRPMKKANGSRHKVKRNPNNSYM